MLYLRRVSTTAKHKVFLLCINISLWVFPRVCGWVGCRKSTLGEEEWERRLMMGREQDEIRRIY